MRAAISLVPWPLLLAAHAGAALPPLIPTPRQVVERPGTLALRTPLVLQTEVQAASATDVLERVFGLADQDGTVIRLVPAPTDQNLDPEWYRLRVEEDTLEIAATSEAGFFYGVHTLRQLHEGSGDALPCCEVTDWPAMRWRGVDYPVTRPEDLQRLAGLKLNLVVWEVSGRYRSPSHPELEGTMPLEEIAAICAEARRNHITLLLEVQSFGHSHWLLRPHPEFRADPESTHTIRPLVPEVYDLLSDVYGELIEASGVPWFFPGCDEPWQLDQWCRDNGLDPAEVIGKHIARLSELAAEHGARIMVWGDYLLKYPQALQYPDPARVVIVDWHYNTAPEYPSVDTFVPAGFETLVAPSVCPWEPLFPDYAASAPNIVNFVADGHRRGAIGLLNTNWPTGPMPIEALWYGWALGAEASWRPEPVERAAFDERFFRQVFGLPAQEIAGTYFDWQLLNRAWLPAQQATRPAADVLAELARCYSHKVVTQGGPFGQTTWAVRTQEQVTRAAREAIAAHPMAPGDGWRQLGELAASAEALFYPAQPTRDLSLAYGHLYAAAGARAQGDEQDCQAALGQAREALARLKARAREHNDAETERLAGDALRRLDALRQAGDCSPQAILGAPPVEQIPGPAEISPLAAHVPLETEAPPPQARGAGLIFTSAGGAADLRFEVLEAGTYRVWGLLRHSAGIWENGQFARGGHNAVYEGNYGWELDGQPLTETWFGEELNPEDDEALQWAVIHEGELTRGPHTLRVQPRVMNYAIVDRIVFADDPAWEPTDVSP